MGWYATGELESRRMTRFYDIDAANATLPELDGIVSVLREQRAELVRLRDEVLEADSAESSSSLGGSGGSSGEATISADLRTIRLRMQGLIDQMAAGVARIDALGLTLRDIERGLVDFPALVTGRQVWLCWRPGETTIGWWHDLEAGFDGRRPLAELA
jgi:hypothetical protein